MTGNLTLTRRGLLGLGAALALSSRAGSSFAQDAGPWNLRMQSFSAKGTDAQWVSPAKLLDFIKEDTAGRVNIRAFPTGQFVPSKEIADAIGNGVVDAGTFTGNYLYGQMPALEWAGQPICKDRDEWYKVMDSGGREYVDGLLADMNMVALSVYPIDDIIIFASTKGPIKTLADFKGLRMRGPGGIVNQFMEKQGAGVTVLAMSDAYTSLQTGVIDGMNTSLAGYTTMKGWEVAPYMTWAKGLNVVICQVVAINKGVWDSFPDDVKKAIRSAEARHRQWDASYIEQFKTDSLDLYRKNGATVTILEPEEATRWREAYLPISLPSYLTTGEQSKHMIDLAQKTLGRQFGG